MKALTIGAICALLALGSAGAADAKTRSRTGSQTKSDLRWVLGAFEEGVRVDGAGRLIASDFADSGGPPVREVEQRSQARERGVVYVVNVMPKKGLLYLLERDRRGRAHSLFVDYLGVISIR